MPAPFFADENLQMDGHSASHPKREAVAQCRVQLFVGRSRCPTARSLRIAFPDFRYSSAAPRTHAHAVELTTRSVRAHLMRAARTLSRSQWISCDNLGLFCPPAWFGGGFFRALPPVSPVFLIRIVRTFLAVHCSRTRAQSANRSAGSPAARRLLVRCMNVSNASVSLFGFSPSGRLVCHNCRQITSAKWSSDRNCARSLFHFSSTVALSPLIATLIFGKVTKI
jgi:hypothetical protein